MSDRTPEQLNSSLDRTEQILSDLTVKLDSVIVALANIPELEERNRRRHQQHDLELDDHDERIERLERILLESETRQQAQEAQLAELKESRVDIKTMLEILVRRTIGETGEEPNE